MPELEEIYTARRSETDPPTVGEYLKAQNSAEEDEFALSIARTLMDHPNIGQSFNNMHWQVLDVSNDDFPLLTSDRPIWMTLSITEEDAFISMPIGPRKLFTAAVNSSTQMRLRERSRGQLVKEVNKLATQHAVRFVYGLDDKALPFVQKHMASKRHSTLLERVAAKHGHEIVAADSPSAPKKS